MSERTIRPRDRDAILQSLSAGVVPRPRIAIHSGGPCRRGQSAASGPRPGGRRRWRGPFHHRGIRQRQDVFPTAHPHGGAGKESRHYARRLQSRPPPAWIERPGAQLVRRAHTQHGNPLESGRGRHRRRGREVHLLHHGCRPHRRHQRPRRDAPPPRQPLRAGRRIRFRPCHRSVLARVSGRQS